MARSRSTFLFPSARVFAYELTRCTVRSPRGGGGGGGTSGRNVNGEGSVYQRKDGRWVAAADVPAVGGTVHLGEPG